MYALVFKNPAAAVGTEEDILNTFRKVRDKIKEKIVKFLQEIPNG